MHLHTVKSVAHGAHPTGACEEIIDVFSGEGHQLILPETWRRRVDPHGMTHDTHMFALAEATWSGPHHPVGTAERENV